MFNAPEQTYWNEKGKHQLAVEYLNTLIPEEGSVPEPRKNRALEKFRKASNCYYDLYNNGLCNRGTEFYHVFGIRRSDYKSGPFWYSSVFYRIVEHKMDEIVANAFREQLLGYGV